MCKKNILEPLLSMLPECQLRVSFFGMGNTCKLMTVSFQCMTKSTTIKKIKIKKKSILLSQSSLYFPLNETIMIAKIFVLALFQYFHYWCREYFPELLINFWNYLINCLFMSSAYCLLGIFIYLHGPFHIKDVIPLLSLPW